MKKYNESSAFDDMCSALNQASRCVVIGLGLIGKCVETLLAEDEIMELESRAKLASQDELIDGMFSLAGANIFHAVAVVLRYVDRESLYRHDDFVGLYGGGRFMNKDLRRVFVSSGIRLES